MLCLYTCCIIVFVLHSCYADTYGPEVRRYSRDSDKVEHSTHQSTSLCGNDVFLVVSRFVVKRMFIMG